MTNIPRTRVRSEILGHHVHTPFLEAGDSEFLRSKLQKLLHKAFTHITVCVYTCSLEAGGPECIKTKLRANAYTQFVDNNFMYMIGSVSTLSLEAGGPGSLKTKSMRINLTDSLTACINMCAHPPLPKQVAQNF